MQGPSTMPPCHRHTGVVDPTNIDVQSDVDPEAVPRIRSVLVSFDIDGTLESGDPPGPLAMSIVRTALELGYIVGSASDRLLAEQRRMWAAHDIEPDFVSHKHTLDRVATQFSSSRRIHIGDTSVDAHYAQLANFEFVLATIFPEAGTPGWIF
jgi:hypothetical protein